MKKIKGYIIHLLGGCTKEEMKSIYTNGKLVSSVEIKKYLDSMNGKPADEWCKKAYEFVCSMLEG